MKIAWYGTAAVMIEAAGERLLFDPYMKDLPRDGEPKWLALRRKQAFLSANQVLITHGHLDHLASVAFLYKNRSCTIYATHTPLATLLGQQMAARKLHQIAPGDVLTFGAVTVHVYQGKHIAYDAGVIRALLRRITTREQVRRLLRLGWQNKRHPENGETLAFEISAEGKRILLLGSADLDAGVIYPRETDVLILPHQGRSDIDAHNKALVRALQPRRVLLNHYDDAFPPVSSAVAVEAFCEEMSREIPTEKMIEGKTYCIE